LTSRKEVVRAARFLGDLMHRLHHVVQADPSSAIAGPARAAGVAHHEVKRDARHEAGLRLEHIGLEALRPNSAISRLAAAAATISYGAAYIHRAAAPTQSNGVREILQLQ
jgi:hypothetical protein